MSELNGLQTGKPPAGEVGICRSFYKDLVDGFAMWRGEYFSSHYAVRGAKYAFGDITAKPQEPITSWRWANLPELIAAGLTEDEALPMLHESQRPAQPERWYPPQQEGFTEWREHKRGARCPVDGDAVVRWCVLARREKRSDIADYSHCEGRASALNWTVFIVAYCVKLDQPAAVQPDANAPMHSRDAVIKEVVTPVKDEGWREYDPNYPPIQPYPMEFKQDGDRHFYRRTDLPEDDLSGLALLHEHRADRYGRFGRWGA